MKDETPEQKAQRMAYQKEYYATHPEYKAKKAAYGREYYATHPEQGARQNERSRIYRATHREEIALKQRAYKLAHRTETNACQREYRRTHKEKVVWYQRKRKYGLSMADFDAVLENQGGVCAICKQANWLGKGSVVDHDHISGKVRGILCSNCNTAIGLLHDDPKTLQSMIDYLRGTSVRAERRRDR